MFGQIIVRLTDENLERKLQIETKGVPRMSHRSHARAPAETPIERIFEKVMRRKMTSQERIYFHLQRKIKPPMRVNTNRQTRAA